MPAEKEVGVQTVGEGAEVAAVEGDDGIPKDNPPPPPLKKKNQKFQT